MVHNRDSNVLVTEASNVKMKLHRLLHFEGLEDRFSTENMFF